MITKEIILKESMKLFSTKGFDSEIASFVGVGNSALYKHFTSKQAIFDALVIVSTLEKDKNAVVNMYHPELRINCGTCTYH